MILSYQNQDESKNFIIDKQFLPEISNNLENSFPDKFFRFNTNISGSLFSSLNEDSYDSFIENPFPISISTSTPSQNVNFLVKKVHRGRLGKKENNVKKHLNTDLDNLLSKIQVHFITFILNISNDALTAEFGKNKDYEFKNIDYKIKYDIRYNSFIKLKNSSIKDVLKLRISPKYKHYDPEINSIILEEICSKSSWLDKFFSMNYIELFEKFYYQKTKIININFEGKVIDFNEKTKTFYDLLQKYKNLKNDLINNVNSNYLNKTKKNNKTKFTSIKSGI